ncbi:terminase large subunit domain-containing protein [Candidatus Contendibacter odensensis]|uniref:Terminase large subunit gp17-like C-terminal domain-containing protein n=1 Tax=Candidatus Contendobacter odensis Run_B_J11 TaxID=1400861 RepID=A0A7U7J5L7_9GAMM|nr:terminase family protein [Candidatus Contendobacter odensis]CDH46957.1 conserved hypothetical protein [Candidatus Contendobacter odensis Run_B_J11]
MLDRALQRSLKIGLPRHLRYLQEDQQSAIMRRIEWLSSARSSQLIPPGMFIHLILAGRGFGKTLTASQEAWWLASSNPGWRIAVVAPTAGDLRRTVFEGDSGLLRVTPAEVLRGGEIGHAYNRSLFEMHFKNGSLIQGFAATEPDRLRGPQFHAAFCDELAAWSRLQDTWDQLMMTLRLGKQPRVVIATTPRPVAMIKQLLARQGQDVYVVRGSTFENVANLAPGFIATLRQRYEGTRLARQELYAEVLEDVPGALWQRTEIDQHRAKDTPALQRVVVAVDPAVSNTEGSDETGIIVAGLGTDRRGYVLEDATLRGAPDEWARQAVRMYDAHRADLLVSEVNNGGDLVMATVKTAAQDLFQRGERPNPEINQRKIHSSRGKVIRAEPIAALYAQGRVSHIHSLPTLEDQMCVFTSDFDRGKSGYSPDRVDALVFALSELMLNQAPIVAGAAGRTRESPWQ